MKTIAIIGVGLIGGSVALALRRAQPGLRVLGVDRDAVNLEAARSGVVIDEAVTIEAAAGADVVLIAVPVQQYATVLAELAPHLSAATLLTDAGSTKQKVIAEARHALGARIGQFIPGHPIAGRENSGVGAATADLFAGKNVVLTPLAENQPQDVQALRTLWQSCGANVVEITADQHDAIFAAVSHLPHMLAFALVDELASRPNAKSLFSHAAAGFRDFTRIAGSHPEMWRDIALDNRAALVAEFDRYLARAQALRDAIAGGDAATIEQLMARARRARNDWMAGELEQFRDEIREESA